MTGKLRWDPYVFASGDDECAEQWEAPSTEDGRTLLICGVGFDPRTLNVIGRLVEARPGRVDVLALELHGEGPASIRDLAAANRDHLGDQFGDITTFVPPVEVDDVRTAGVVLTRKLVSEHAIADRSHVVVDVSALPSSVYFPLVKLLASDGLGFNGDLQVCVMESPELDEKIVATGLDEATTLPGFPRLSDGANVTRVWVPVIGDGRSAQLRGVMNLVSPNEVCPVLPFPSSRARKPDDLLLANRELLFDELLLEPRNILYAAESNPFDLYRQLVELADRYRRALSALGGAEVIVSQHSSKLLSLGLLLAAIDRDLVVAHVRPTGYDMAVSPVGETVGGSSALDGSQDRRMHSLWLTGYPYRKAD